MTAISGIANLQSITASQQSAVGKAETIKDKLGGQTGLMSRGQALPNVCKSLSIP